MTGSLFVRGIFDGHHYFKIEEIGNGTIRFTQGENYKGILSSIILKFIGKETQEGFEKMNFALKKLAEEK